MAKCRTIERTNVDGRKEFVIQQKHFLFSWLWVDAWVNSSDGASCISSFSTFEEAQENLCYFDGSKCYKWLFLNWLYIVRFLSKILMIKNQLRNNKWQTC